ncbi:MAG: hypothetical protein IJD92_04380 [Bacilli bacterium]|nr:hypothetical protein [Bacilli bacterium]
MNNSINILDHTNQTKNVELINYFKLNSNNKNYLFYSNGEIVQDGLIKMYVASEFVDLSNGLTDEEWASLKKVMQNIITGNNGDIKFLNYNNQIKLNESKAIALSQANIDIMKKVYSESPKEETVLNKDLLANSFSNANVVNQVEPVQLSSIPTIQNGPSLENEPVNLNAVPSIEPVTIEPTMPTTVEPIVETNIPSIDVPTINEPVVNNQTVNVVPEVSVPNIQLPNQEPVINSGINDTGFENINELDKYKIEDTVPTNNVGIESGFKVSDQPNIFDQVNSGTNTLDQLNKSNEVIESPVVNVPTNNKDMSKLIEINERKAKLYEELASLYREENKLYETNGEINNLENTASNLFNNNGILDVNNF